MAFFNFLYNRSLWFDEALLSLNIVGKSYAELLRPLDDNQVAPIGFLYVEKFISSLFGSTDWSLRIFPFFSFLFSIPLLFSITKKLTDSKQVGLLACVFFVFNYLIIYYSVEVKQYSSDVCIVLFLIYYGLIFFKLNDYSSIFIYSAVGVFAIFLSNVSIVILLSNSFVLIYNYYKKREKLIHRFIIPVLFWISAFCIYYFLFIHHHPSKRSMLRYWQSKDAFLPLNPFHSDFFTFIFSKLKMIFTYLIIDSVAGWILIPIFITGLLKSFKNFNTIIVLCCPLIIHLFLSGLKMYPFHTRLILYLVPLIIIVLSVGLYHLHRIIKLSSMSLSYLILFSPLIFSFIVVVKNAPIEKEEVRNCMEYINRDKSRIDFLYLYCSSAPAFKFYQKKFSILTNIDSIVYGDWHRENWNLHANDVLRLKGNSWLIFSEVYSYQGKNEEQFIIDRLRFSGYQIVQQKKYVGASCYQVIKP